MKKPTRPHQRKTPGLSLFCAIGLASMPKQGLRHGFMRGSAWVPMGTDVVKIAGTAQKWRCHAAICH